MTKLVAKGLMTLAIFISSHTLTGCNSASHAIPTPTSQVRGDCGWIVDVYTWEDRNENGIREQDEPALSQVPITLDWHDEDTAGAEPTDEGGHVRLTISLWGCPSGALKMRASPPTGYQATTPTELLINVSGENGSTQIDGTIIPAPEIPVLSFGFTRK